MAVTKVHGTIAIYANNGGDELTVPAALDLLQEPPLPVPDPLHARRAVPAGRRRGRLRGGTRGRAAGGRGGRRAAAPLPAGPDRGRARRGRGRRGRQGPPRYRGRLTAHWAVTADRADAVPWVDYRWHRRSWRRWSGRRLGAGDVLRVPEAAGAPARVGDVPGAPAGQARAAPGDRGGPRGPRRRHGRQPQRPAASPWRGQRRVTHVGHFILTLLTGGLWGIVWLAVILNRREDRVRYEVDAWGNIWPVDAP